MIDEIKEVSTNNSLQEEQKMTEEVYSKEKGELIASIFRCFLWVLLFAAPLIFYIATFDIEDYNSEVHAYGMGLISLITATPCLIFFKLIKENMSELSKLQDEYCKTLQNSELVLIEKKKRRIYIAIWSMISVVVISAIAYATSLEIRAFITYNDAIELYRAARYDEAIAQFESLDNKYDDVDDYLNLCQAYRYYYVYDNETGAYYHMKKVNHIHNISDEELAEIEELRALLAKQHKEKIEKQEMIEKQNLAKEEEKAKNSLPYIGMKELYINKTILGQYGNSYRYDFEYGEGMRLIETRLYQFFDSKGNVIFDVYCKEGYVIRVGDHRNKAKQPSAPKYDWDDYDPYDIDRFSNAEDFYDDNWDYFMSYEDAESYFNKHKNK